MKNIVLTGFMGTGKTTVGRELARLLDMKLIDIDAGIESEEGLRIPEIFSRFGEERFRDIEAKAIRKYAASDHAIISTGGGAVLRAENIEALRINSIIFCLSASPETVLKRTARNDDRPLLKAADPLQNIFELMQYRRPFYEKAGIMIDTDDKTPLQVAEEIAAIYHADAYC
ncbi:MAG: shikimate kinase [Thermodesulfovibrio sp.]|nr:shikimate kinase [Thermodesulfovibrio sp.]